MGLCMQCESRRRGKKVNVRCPAVLRFLKSLDDEARDGPVGPLPTESPSTGAPAPPHATLLLLLLPLLLPLLPLLLLLEVLVVGHGPR